MESSVFDRVLEFLAIHTKKCKRRLSCLFILNEAVKCCK